MPSPYTIENPNINDSNGIVDLKSTASGNIQPGAKAIAFYNAGTSGASTPALVGVAGNLVAIPPGVSRNYPVIMGPGGVYGQEIAWDAQGCDLYITVVY